MHYTIHFFALDAPAVAEKFQQEPAKIADRVVELMKAGDDVPDEQVADSRELAQSICTGKFSEGEAHEEINVLCWICEAVGEKIDIPPFNFFRSLNYLDDIGVWPLFQAEKPPFPVPTADDELPEVGFMSRSAIKRQTASEFAELPECSDPEAEDARDELLGILESLCNDNVDLIAILVEN